MQNSCRENFGKFGELNVIHQYFTQSNLALISMALLKFFQVMIKQPDLPDSVIRVAAIGVASLFLTGKKLSDHKNKM